MRRPTAMVFGIEFWYDPIKSLSKNALHVNSLNHLSVGYLFPNAARSDFFDKNNFRIGTGGVDLKGEK